MKVKFLPIAIAIVAFAQTSYAQYSQDAFRFSTFEPGSSARIKAIGNAGTAVGGDVSSVGFNPAGLGFFTKSEFSLTPEVNSSKVNSNYFNVNNSDTKNQFNLNNVSLVFAGKASKRKGSDLTKGFVGFNFGVSYGRTNDFYQNTYYSGVNPNNNLADYLVEQARNFGVDGVPQSFGYSEYLFDNIAAANQPPVYEANTDLNSTQINQRTTTGGQNEFNLALGANYSNKLYLGVGLSFNSLRYRSTNVFSESGHQFVDDVDYNTDYTVDQDTRGSGFSAKFGVIYKPVEFVRIGASINTPTWYSIDDVTSYRMRTAYVQSNTYTDGPEDYEFNYDLTTPFRASGGLAFFLGNYGFITGDIEYVDYASMKISGNGDAGYDESADNRDLRDLYKSTVNTRVGIEGKLDDFFIRGGYNYRPNPEKFNGSAIETYSAGLGYRKNNLSLDFTYTNVFSKRTDYPYTLDPTYDISPANAISPAAALENKTNNFYLTLGVRF
ncbi:hypothetical protein GS399_04320 [Pedobacter sp. HMF7647]|uniref:Hemin receptor n=1 Tax=Hufsiella arboris TaxID=2695275 RepID=A0A7K1Y6I8_9SPHI|nr:hypothetical protein [Hufsiella arboris]MXV50185.1 hypothetical protein [Hufsiella arboris]